MGFELKRKPATNQSSSITTTLQASSIASSLAIEIGKNKIAAGGEYTCALLSDGSAKCWGYNGFGQLGDGTTTNSTASVLVAIYNYYSR